MDIGPKPGPSGSKLAYIPGAEPLARIDPWWGLVVLVVGLVVILVTVKADPFRDILLFVRDGVGVTALITVTAFVFILVLGMIGGLGLSLIHI